MTQFAQVSRYLFVKTSLIHSFHIAIKDIQDMTECYYVITYRNEISYETLNDKPGIPVKFQSEDEAVSYLKRYFDNGMRLLD